MLTNNNIKNNMDKDTHLRYLNLLLDKYKLRKYLLQYHEINLLEIIETSIFMMTEFINEHQVVLKYLLTEKI